MDNFNLSDVVNSRDVATDFMRELVEREFNALLRAHFEDFIEMAQGRGETAVKNGSYGRKFKTSFGPIEVSIPRDRANLYRDCLPPRIHSIPALEDDILALYDRSMTYSEISQVLSAKSGCPISESTIQKVVQSAYGEYEKFMNEPLPDCPFIFLDGTWINLKRAYTEGRANVQGECVMVALGYTNDGKKRVLSFSVTPNEGASAWEKVLGDLKERGCRNPLMFITDGLQGMTEAIARVFPKARHQRCVVHVSRNLLNMCRKRDRSAVAEDFKRVYEKRTLEEARAELAEFLKKWGRTYERFRSILSDPDIFSYCELPWPIQRSIYTSNAIEGFNSRVKATIRKRVSMNSIGNCLYSILAAVRWYNASASRRTLRCLKEMTDGELKQCGFTVRAS